MLKVALGVRYVGSLVCAVGSVYVMCVGVVVVAVVYVEQQHNRKHHVHDVMPWRSCEWGRATFCTRAHAGRTPAMS